MRKREGKACFLQNLDVPPKFWHAEGQAWRAGALFAQHHQPQLCSHMVGGQKFHQSLLLQAEQGPCTHPCCAKWGLLYLDLSRTARAGSSLQNIEIKTLRAACAKSASQNPALGMQTARFQSAFLALIVLRGFPTGGQ